jgi:hypothetical protein
MVASADKFTGNSSNMKFIKVYAALLEMLMLTDRETNMKNINMPIFAAPLCENDSRNDVN